MTRMRSRPRECEPSLTGSALGEAHTIFPHERLMPTENSHEERQTFLVEALVSLEAVRFTKARFPIN